MFSWGQETQHKTKPSIEHSRAEHLRSYENHPTLKPSTRRMSRNDDSTNDTVFQTRGGHNLILRVHLSIKNTAPSMALIGARLTHPWIDSQHRITGYSPIASDRAWKSSGILLGEAVSQVVLHLQLNPPTVIEITDPHLRKMQPIQNMNVAPPSYDSVLEPEPEIDFSFEIPTSFPTLDTMSNEEVSHILNDSSAYNEFFSILPAKGVTADFKSDITTNSFNKAQEMIKKKDTMENLSKEVESLTIDFQGRMEKYERLNAKKEELRKPQDVDEIKKKLIKAKKTAFEESEELANEWVDGSDDSTLKEFLKEFLEKRDLFHERAAKIEMLTSKQY